MTEYKIEGNTTWCLQFSHLCLIDRILADYVLADSFESLKGHSTSNSKAVHLKPMGRTVQSPKGHSTSNLEAVDLKPMGRTVHLHSIM